MPGEAPSQNLLPPVQPQMLLALQVAVPPQSLVMLQHGCVSGCLAVYVQLPLLQTAAF
jgi:hypothetical protein